MPVFVRGTEVAQKLGLSHNTIKKVIRSNQIPYRADGHGDYILDGNVWNLLRAHLLRAHQGRVKVHKPTKDEKAKAKQKRQAAKVKDGADASARP